VRGGGKIFFFGLNFRCIADIYIAEINCKFAQLIKFTIYRYEKDSEKVCQFFIKLEREKKKNFVKKKRR